MLQSPRTRVRRKPDRGIYDTETIYSILDEAFICHVGFVVDGRPYVLPTAYGRQDATIYLHGSPQNRMLRTLSGGGPVCITVTLLDGLVLARSTFHHSLNYRSVVILGTAEVVTDTSEKDAALRVLVEHIVRGRSAEARSPDDKELAATQVLRVAIDEASAKVRTGPPSDLPADEALPVWAGELPLRLAPQTPIPDPTLASGIQLPRYLADYTR